MKLTDEQVRVYEILEHAAPGGGLPDDEVEALYAVDPMSREAYAIRHDAHLMSLAATGGKAEIHAQIGLNGSPCGKNCKFCSFAVCNGLRSKLFELEPDDVKRYCDLYQEQGANLVLMLATASYPFEKYLEMVEVARSVLDPEMPLLANYDDVTLEQACRLKAAGVDGAYHAVRMGEGVDTTIPVEKRLQTMRNLRDAGLSLQTCVEPIGPEHTPAELVIATRRCIDSGANSAGCGRRITVPGTQVENRGQLNDLQNSLNVAVYRLATGLAPALNCAVSTPITATSGGNLGWAEVGLNPRDTAERTENGGRGNDIAYYRWVYANAGWEVLDGYSQGWKLPTPVADAPAGACPPAAQ